MIADSSVTIRKMTVDCLVSTAARGHGIENDLCRIVRRELEVALADCLQALKNSGEALVHIQRLELELDVDLSLTEAEIARAWAIKITQALLTAMRLDTASGTAVFTSPAHYLRSALLDIVRGRINQLWYYREFRGLWALPTSVAVRTALLRDPSLGLEALRQVPPDEAMEVCAALTASDAQQLLDGLCPLAEHPHFSVQTAQHFIQSIAANMTLAYRLHATPPAQVLLLAVLSFRMMSTSEPGATRVGAELLSLLMQLRHDYPQQFSLMLPLLNRSRAPELKRWMGAPQISALLPLLETDKSAVQVLAQALQPRLEKMLSAESEADTANGFTWFGNALLLLPEINRLPLFPVRCWPDLDQQPAEKVMRWLVLCVCQEREKFFAAAQDPLLRSLCGLSSHVTLVDVAAWLNSGLAGQQCEQVRTLLKQQCVAELVGPGQTLDEEVIRCPWHDGALIVHKEKIKGRWLRLAVTGHNSIQTDSGVLCEPECDARQQRVQKDLSHVWLSEKHAFDVAARAFLANLAQFTLASFAYRLPGFAGSSLPYVWRNFLSMSARLLAEDRVINAYLSRVPMGVLLNMAGINRGTLQLTDFDPRPIRLLEAP